MNNAINLLPCPMCGCNSITIKNEQPTDNSGGYFIECPDCGTGTSLRYACGDDPMPLLAEQWNRRTSTQYLHQIAEPAAPLEKEIDDAIAALIRAALVEGGCSVERVIEAREQTRKREEELRTLLSSAQSGEQAAPQAVQAAVLGITFDFKQANELLEMFGGEPGEVTVGVGDGHSGRGLYAVWNADPEGSVYLGVTDDEAAPAHPADGVPAQDEAFGAGVDACIDKLNELNHQLPWSLKQSEALSEAIAALEALATTHTTQQGLEPLAKWGEGVGLLWDVDAFGKWLCRVVSPVNWDAHAVYLALVRARYSEGIDVRQVHVAAQAKQGGAA